MYYNNSWSILIFPQGAKGKSILERTVDVLDFSLFLTTFCVDGKRG